VRDICVLSIHSLGGWLQAYPSLFLADTFTKYLGWSLYAKEAPIRAHGPRPNSVLISKICPERLLSPPTSPPIRLSPL